MDPIHWFGEGGIFPFWRSTSAIALSLWRSPLSSRFPSAATPAIPVKGRPAHRYHQRPALLPSFGLIILLVILLSGEFESDMAFILPCILVLVALALPPIALGVHAGIRALDPYVLDAARGMGMTRLQILLQVELPCALPLILSGVRSATLQIISTATIAAYVSLGDSDV
jgi:osmoprotectant transport system permease protein